MTVAILAQAILAQVSPLCSSLGFIRRGVGVIGTRPQSFPSPSPRHLSFPHPRFIMSCTQLQSFQQLMHFQYFQFQQFVQFQHFQQHQWMKIEHLHRSTWTTRSTCRTWPAGGRPPTPTRNEVRHKDFGTEEYNTSQLQTEETTHTKQEKHEDFCIEEFNTGYLQTEETTHTNQLQAERTTRTKHDQQAKIEDSCAEEFDTNQLKREKENDALIMKEMLAMFKESEEWLKKSAEELEEIRKPFARDTG